MIFFLFLLTLEPPQWGASNEYPQSMLLSKNKKTHNFSFVNYHLTAVKNCSILHSRVCVMIVLLITIHIKFVFIL